MTKEQEKLNKILDQVFINAEAVLKYRSGEAERKLREQKLYLLFGRSIKRLRKAKGITLQEFAKELGLVKSHLFNIENGHRSVTESTIEKVKTWVENNS